MNHNTKISCPAYKEFIRSKPCCVCGRSPVDGDHLKARGFGSGKQNDLTVIPLCRQHHAERGHIGNYRFEWRYGVNLWQVAAMFLIEFFVFVDPVQRATIHVSEKGPKKRILL